MYRSPSFRSIEKISTLIGQSIKNPIVLNSQESKQLLNLLTTTFRRQLDIAHSSPEKAQFHPNNSSKSIPQTQKLSNISNARNNSVDALLYQVLTNPVLANSKNTYAGTSKSTQGPTDYFDKAVAAGLMDLKHAGAYLHARLTQIILSDTKDIRSAMKASGVGLKVLKWLTSSNDYKELLFLKDEKFMHLFVRYLVAEGLQAYVWVWAHRRLQSIPLKKSSHYSDSYKSEYRSAILPLMVLIKSEIFKAANLSSAYMCLQKADEYLQNLSAQRMTTPLWLPGLYLFRKTIFSFDEMKPPSESAFESFIALVPRITTKPLRIYSHLYLLHPTKPSADLALKYLRQLSQTDVCDLSLRERKEITQLIVRTAGFLHDNGSTKNADWVMNSMRSWLPHHQGSEARKHQEKSELSRLYSIDSLELVNIEPA
ncbi:BgTH12-02935 [Blumeria graminis f. sp. triticale]|uniref:Bgt-1639 n=3 Tax=Blumeria graminis TaxID=34373 RepID=A0A061HDI5_BLUGR|nr:hypothetical protein BGT96224_1639 [Blumeria graminis f. sp. tritici 96224]CAD6503268.1 BgTH12-02935 [Blumeria graminis f. sp. triticale]VDB89269.1 Bgt-1639 [Blumeria graminis f. sp. tritici]